MNAVGLSLTGAAPCTDRHPVTWLLSNAHGHQLDAGGIAHTQLDGTYHYHGDPEPLYDASEPTASGVVGFVTDGFPIYGPYIGDGGTIRRAVSGYTRRTGESVSLSGEWALPGGDCDGTCIDDCEYTGAGDLDACSGVTPDGAYGYYVTNAHPWVLGCFTGTPNATFRKGPSKLNVDVQLLYTTGTAIKTSLQTRTHSARAGFFSPIPSGVEKTTLCSS